MNTVPRLLVAFIGLTASISHAAEPAFINTRVMSFDTATTLAITAAKACRKMGYQVTASVVDRNGTLLAVARDPLSGTHTVEISRLKAFTSATFQTATLTMTQDEFKALRDAPDVLLIGGGVPVLVGGQFYGAVGVSGAPAKKITGDIDDDCARQGIKAIEEALEFAE